MNNTRGFLPAVTTLSFVFACSQNHGEQVPVSQLGAEERTGKEPAPTILPTGTKADPEPAPTIPPSGTSSRVPAPYACQADSDCVTTCAHGALNAQWFRKNFPVIGDCFDGCQMGAQAPRCIDGTCVAFRDGKPDDACTKKPIPQIESLSDQPPGA